LIEWIGILLAFACFVLSYALKARFDKVDGQLKKIDERLKFLIER
jgi:hypothetical protein